MAEPEPERVVDAAAFIADADLNVLTAILNHLSPKWILRMRLVYRAWRDMLTHWAACRLAPPQPLICFDRVACPENTDDSSYIRLRDYCIESLDLSSGNPRHVLRFTDREYYEPAVVAQVQLRYNGHLHWPPQESQGYNILVLDIWSEKFSWKRPPPPVMRDQDMKLLEFPNGDLGMSVSRNNTATLELWRLEDYHKEVWVCVYKIQLALQQMMPVLLREDEGEWTPAVVSAQGDVLIQSRFWLFHCDRNGTLLHKLGIIPTTAATRVMPIRHVLRESILQHQMFLVPNVPAGGVVLEPPFFRWLGSDPSW